jgi:hypothetical protein
VLQFDVVDQILKIIDGDRDRVLVLVLALQFFEVVEAPPRTIVHRLARLLAHLQIVENIAFFHFANDDCLVQV